MTAAAYTTDLTTLNTGEATTGWAEPGTWTAGGLPVAETDYFIQGTGCISKTFNATGLGGMVYTTTAQTIPTDGAFLAWQYFAAPNALSTEATGGIRLIVGSSTAAFKAWTLGGSDSYQYGGWQCLAADPTLTADFTVGAPTASYLTFGWAANLANAVAKGNPFGIDAVRVGRGTLQVVGGDLANGYGTFEAAATQNDNVTNRWGLCQFQDGGYKLQGHFLMGTAATAVDFRDSNKSLTILNTKKVSANFNLFEVRNAASRVDWTNTSIQALGTVSKGRFLMTANATVNKDGCTFTDMDTFVYQSNATITGTTYRRCGQITQGGAPLTGCLITRSTAATALLASNVGAVTGCDFVSSGTGYAIEGFATAGDYTVATNTFTGYGATGTVNAALRVTATTGVVNISAPGGTTYHSAGATVNIISGQRTLTLTGIVSGSDVVILAAGTTTELANVDASVGSTYAYSYTYTASTFIDVCVYKAGYVPSTVRGYLLADGDGSLPISQVLDRNYLP